MNYVLIDVPYEFHLNHFSKLNSFNVLKPSITCVSTNIIDAIKKKYLQIETYLFTVYYKLFLT